MGYVVNTKITHLLNGLNKLTRIQPKPATFVLVLSRVGESSQILITLPSWILNSIPPTLIHIKIERGEVLLVLMQVDEAERGDSKDNRILQQPYEILITKYYY